MRAVFSLICLIPLILAPTAAWNQLHTTFPFSDVLPFTKHEAVYDKNSHWSPISDEGDCLQSDDGNWYAGVRWWDNQKNMNGEKHNTIIIYDYVGNLAGIQSLVPREDFTWDCTENPYYTITTIQGREYCTVTVYTQYNPRYICHDYPLRRKWNSLSLQYGRSFRNYNESMDFPSVHWACSTADNVIFWQKDKYFLGMGHHCTPIEGDPENCKMAKPIQALYGNWKYNDGSHKCTNSGFVFVHYGTNTTGKGWEKPDSKAVKLILSNPSQCQLKAADNGLITSMHVFLKDTTSYCWGE